MARNVAVKELRQPLYRRAIDFGKPLFIIPFGCIHKGSPEHAEHDWQKFCEHYEKFQDNNQCLYIGMGDYAECVSRRERVALSSPDIHDSTLQLWDKEGELIVRSVVKDIGFMKGRLLGLVEGNHYWEFTDGTTTTMRLCNLLDCQYLAGGLYGKLQLLDGKSLVRYTVDIYAAHGTGNTITVGGSIMKGERFAGSVKANIYVLGHDHQHILADLPLIEVGLTKDGKEVRTTEYRRCVVRSGSFMRMYQKGSKSYGLERLYKPTGIGSAQIEICFSESHSGDRYFTLNPQLKTW